MVFHQLNVPSILTRELKQTRPSLGQLTLRSLLLHEHIPHFIKPYSEEHDCTTAESFLMFNVYAPVYL